MPLASKEEVSANTRIMICIKIYGQTNEENLYRMERQFKYSNSIKIIRMQVEKYEELLQEQLEKTERANRNREKAERLQRETEKLKN
jgi:hypothetical protein